MSRAIYFADPFHQKKSLWNLSVFEFNQELACVRYLRKHFQPLSTGEIQADVLLEILISKVSRNRDLYLEEWEGGEYGDTFDYRDFIENYIKTGKWLPIQEGLVAIYGADLTSDDITLELTERGINELLVELDPERKQRLTDLGSITVPYIKPENIVYQELFFGEDLQQQIEPLKKSLDPEIQEKIKLALTGKEFGLSGLFYGIPGSGKTELCYQLAKEYELPIMTVDVAKIQSKWVGESEKNAREIFASYRKLCRQTKKKCILLFNEADALFARRINVNSSVDQMNNALKNIFLEGMEQLNGVLLATTNLSANIDPAFERRFLFKIKFDLPSLQTQTRIWQSYFSTLSAEQAMHLAKQFNLSPGQIANVKRKQIIEEILYPEKVFFEVITQLASVERLVKDHETRMGF